MKTAKRNPIVRIAAMLMSLFLVVGLLPSFLEATPEHYAEGEIQSFTGLDVSEKSVYIPSNLSSSMLEGGFTDEFMSQHLPELLAEVHYSISEGEEDELPEFDVNQTEIAWQSDRAYDGPGEYVFTANISGYDMVLGLELPTIKLGITIEEQANGNEPESEEEIGMPAATKEMVVVESTKDPRVNSSANKTGNNPHLAIAKDLGIEIVETKNKGTVSYTAYVPQTKFKEYDGVKLYLSDNGQKDQYRLFTLKVQSGQVPNAEGKYVFQLATIGNNVTNWFGAYTVSVTFNAQYEGVRASVEMAKYSNIDTDNTWGTQFPNGMGIPNPEDVKGDKYEFVRWELTYGAAQTWATDPGKNDTGTTFSTNLIYTAIFELKEYTVTFVDWDKTTTERLAKHGTGTTAPTAKDDQEGHGFIGWFDDDGNEFDPKEPVTRDYTYKAHYQAIVQEPADEEEDEARTGDGTTDDVTADDGITDDGITDDGTTDDATTDDITTDDATTDNGTTDDTTTDDGTTGDTTTDDETTDDEAIVAGIFGDGGAGEGTTGSGTGTSSGGGRTFVTPTAMAISPSTLLSAFGTPATGLTAPTPGTIPTLEAPQASVPALEAPAATAATTEPTAEATTEEAAWETSVEQPESLLERLAEGTNPLVSPDRIDITDAGTALAGPAIQNWALVNLVCTVLTGLLSIVLLIGYLGRKRRDEEDDSEGNEETRRRKGLARVFSIIPAVIAIVAFILTELPLINMVMVDRWTIVMVFILLIQVIVALFAKKSWEENEDEDEEAMQNA